MPTAPDFLIIGAAKAGTTALWNWLRQHPEIYLPDVKEPSFFAYHDADPRPRKGPYDPDYYEQIVTSRLDYEALFPSVEDRLRGEASPIYMLSSSAPEAIKAMCPQARLIAILRDPVVRAFSQFRHHLRDGFERTRDFSKALDDEIRGLRDDWSPFHRYLQVGEYGAQLERFFQLFPAEQILVLRHEHMERRPKEALGRVCRFLGIAEIDHVDFAHRYNAASCNHTVPRIQAFKRLSDHRNPLKQSLSTLLPTRLRRSVRYALQRINVASAPSMPPAAGGLIGERLAEDQARLQALIGTRYWHDKPSR